MQRIVTWDPFTALARSDREFDSLVRRTWPSQSSSRAGFVPAAEIHREGQDVRVVLELPGVDVSQDVTIEVDRGKLIVSGERRGDDGEGVLVREMRYGSFRREFALPGGVTAEQVEATYDAGLLSVLVRNAIAPDPVPVQIPIGTSSPRDAKVVNA